MARKHHSRKLDCDSSEDNKSDTEYKIELEDSEESDSYSEEEIKSKSKRSLRIKSKKKVCRMKKRGLLWRVEDEITVLKQLCEFLENNANSYSPNAFYEFVKKRLNNNIGQVSMKQLSKKIDGLEKEYLENECRRKHKCLEFSGRHEWLVFVLSKRIWGPKKSSNIIEAEMKRATKFMEFLQQKEIHISCLTPSCLEYLKKEWQLHLLMHIDLLSNKAKFDAKLRKLLFTNSLNSSTTQP